MQPPRRSGPRDAGAVAGAVPPARAPSAADAFEGSLPAAGRELVLSVARRRTYRAGEVVVRQGDDATSMYLIERGRVLVRLDDAGGDSLILGLLGPGDMFGELGLVGAQHERTATAEAVDDVSALALRADDFRRLRRDSTDVDDFVMAALARQVERLSRLLAEAMYVSVDRRVARRLYEAGRTFATADGPVVVPLTQEQVAQLVGTTRPTVNQSLKNSSTSAWSSSRGARSACSTCPV